MRKKRETAEIKAWREILVTAEADCEIEAGRLKLAQINAKAREDVWAMAGSHVERVRAKLAELEGIGRL